MIDAIDHLVILVSDLTVASADYAALGFTVRPGGEHTDGATHNALIVFADDSYLELIAFKRPEPAHRWWRHVHAGEGLVDYALLPGTIEADLAAARARGLPFEGPAAGGRLRPDGAQIRWQLGTPQTPDLPFLCGDVTPRALRVPQGDSRRHANGVAGVAGLTVAVADLDVSVGRYRALLGRDPLPVVPSMTTRHAVFTIGPAAVTLAEATGTRPLASAARARLAARGQGPCGLELRTAGKATMLDIGTTHRVPIELVAESSARRGI